MKTDIKIPLGTKIGRGLFLPHFSGIVINGKSVIGKNCTIYQNITIGSKKGENGDAPMIGDNVVIATGAIIIGKIKLGINVMIGANSVILKDVGDNSVVAGNTARVIIF